MNEPAHHSKRRGHREPEGLGRKIGSKVHSLLTDLKKRISAAAAGMHRLVTRLEIKAHHLRWGGLITAAIAAAAVFFVIGAIIRLLMGPVSLGPLNNQLQSAIGNALPGLSVRYDEAALEWTRDEGRVNLVILGARVFDQDQRIIAQAPKAEIVLAAAPFLQGKVQIKRIALVGVQLTLVRTKDGKLRLGMGEEQGQNDVLDQIRRAIERSSEGTSSLQSFAVRKARLAFYDQGTGLFVVAPDAQLEVQTASLLSRQPGLVEADVDAQIEISGHPAHVVGTAKLPKGNGDVKGDVSITGLDVNALGWNSPSFAFLKPYALKTDITGSFTLQHGTRIRYADFGIGAKGTITSFGAPMHVNAIRLVGRYDGATGRLLIDDGSLEGTEASAHLGGSGDLSFTPAGVLTKAALDLTMDKIAINLRGLTNRLVNIDRVSLRGVFTPNDQHFAIDQFMASGGPLSAELTGGITLAPNQTPEIDLQGRVAAMNIREALDYWPLQMAGGARAWIEENVTAGRVGPILIETHIPVGALDLPALPENALNVKLTLTGGTITYIHGLTPITDANAIGVLTGDTFSGDLSSGKVGALTVSKGHAIIPNLHEQASVGEFSAHADGNVQDMLMLIDMKPLQYPTRFHVKTQSAKGTASVDLDFHVPMLRALKVDDVGISVKGGLRDMVLSAGDHLNLTNGMLDFAVDNKDLRAAGTLNLGSSKLAVDWTETFKTTDPYTTLLSVKGSMDDATRAALGIHLSDYISGPININATLQGRRGVIRQAQITADLTSTAVMLDLINYRKPQGQSASANLNAQLDENGNFTSQDITLTGAGGLSARGVANYGATGKLEHLSFPYLRAGPSNDFAMEMTDTPSAGLAVTVSGHSADGTGLGRHNLASDEQNKPKGPLTEPFHFSVKLDRVVLREGVTIAPFAFDTSGVGDRPQTLAMSGVLSKSGSITASLGNNAGTRQLNFSTNDAGQLIRGLFGFTSLHGGAMTLNAKLSPPQANAGNVPVDYTGSLVITDFKVTNQPFLARLFSAASFGGLIDLLRGQGMSVDKLEAPFRMHGGVLDIHDARASGPSLGMSADGYIDRRSNQIALEGAIAPLSGINSILGAIPLVGDVLVSKKGEGVIGMSYAVSGDADEPKISMNPLSVLTPGIFRRIFEGTPHAPPAEANTTTNTPPAQSAPPKQ